MKNFSIRFAFNPRDWVIGVNYEVTDCPGHIDLIHKTIHIALFFFPMLMMILEWDYGYRTIRAGEEREFTIVLPGDFKIRSAPPADADLDPKSGKF